MRRKLDAENRNYLKEINILRRDMKQLKEIKFVAEEKNKRQVNEKLLQEILTEYKIVGRKTSEVLFQLRQKEKMIKGRSVREMVNTWYEFSKELNKSQDITELSQKLSNIIGLLVGIERDLRDLSDGSMAYSISEDVRKLKELHNRVD